jgi:lipoate-protein ligase A
LRSSIGTESSWRVVCVPAVYPAALGLTQLDALADELTGESSAPALLVWRSQRALLVTRQDTHLPRFRETSDEMTAAGWPVVMRKSGGGPCPVGPGTVQVATIEPATSGTTMNAKYDALTGIIQSVLKKFEILTRSGPIADAYCPGSYDLAIGGRKIAGMSQHWFRNRGGIRCVTTAASINVEETPDVLADAVNRFYCAVGSRMRCQAACLASVRLCDGGTAIAAGELALAVMD